MQKRRVRLCRWTSRSGRLRSLPRVSALLLCGAAHAHQHAKELDLSDATAMNKFFVAEHPERSGCSATKNVHCNVVRSAIRSSNSSSLLSIEYVFFAAAKVGGILANNTYPAEFIRDNLVIQRQYNRSQPRRVNVRAPALP